MTVRELITALQDVDDDVLDYTIGVTVRVQINNDIRLSALSRDIRVPNNVDVGNKLFLLKAFLLKAR
jgi:hypothetical protein